MAETGQERRSDRLPTRAELIWEGKYDEQGRPRPVERIALPFQTIEVINEPKARTLFSRTRDEDANNAGTLTRDPAYLTSWDMW
jgi:hypothetical protein